MNSADPFASGRYATQIVKEKEILNMVSLGYTAKEIGDQLKITKRAVEGSLIRIRNKHKAKSNPHLVRIAIINKLIDLP